MERTCVGKGWEVKPSRGHSGAQGGLDIRQCGGPGISEMEQSMPSKVICWFSEIGSCWLARVLGALREKQARRLVQGQHGGWHGREGQDRAPLPRGVGMGPGHVCGRREGGVQHTSKDRLWSQLPCNDHVTLAKPFEPSVPLFPHL